METEQTTAHEEDEEQSDADLDVDSGARQAEVTKSAGWVHINDQAPIWMRCCYSCPPLADTCAEKDLLEMARKSQTKNINPSTSPTSKTTPHPSSGHTSKAMSAPRLFER